MDIRIIKTKKVIKDAFYQLIAKNDIENVKVTELCKLAEINKTTFYKHYQDVYQLESILQQELLNKFFEEFEEKDMILCDIGKFIRGLPKHVNNNFKIINTLFRNNMQLFFFGFEKCLRDYYEAVYPDIDDVILIFILTGIMRTMPILKYEDKSEENEIIDRISKVVDLLKFNYEK